MQGLSEPTSRGIIPRAIQQIFAHIHQASSAKIKFLVRASYLQIYNEVIYDLLNPNGTNLAIREDKKRGVRLSLNLFNYRLCLFKNYSYTGICRRPSRVRRAIAF